MHEFSVGTLKPGDAVENIAPEIVVVTLFDDAMVDIEQGDASYASAAMGLSLHVNLAGQCGFDAADYLSAIV